ncbi:hypothetical protein BC829DRAFT_300490 [Chytridium lagenaria]|nr:hypothetical protein BC829DRAFT_300490 [Chytridium lagenaria]
MSSSSTPQSSEAIPTEAPVAETESLESAVEALSIDAPAEAPTALKKILQKPTSNDAKEPSSTENAASSNTVEEEDDWESAEPVAIPLPYSVHAAPFIPASANTPQVIENINSNRTEYVPQIKIMRREPKNRQNSQQGTSSSSSSASSPTNIAKGLSGRPSSPGSNGGPKTLAEREAEYRAARMRIFGKEEPEVDPEAASSETPVAAGPSNPSSQNPRPARTNTPPMRNNADGHPRIWTPTNQVNAVPAPGDRGFGLSRQPIPPPNNHPALWGGAPVLGRGGQPILTNPTYPGGPNAPFMPMNIGIAPPTLDPSAPRNAFALTPSGVPIPSGRQLP